MKVKEIFLKDEIGPDLGSRQQIEKLFNTIDLDCDEIIMNFEGIEFMGRSFAQEYLNQKKIAPFKVTEKNMSEDTEKMFKLIINQNMEDENERI